MINFNLGIIPPHFVNFLKNEEINITDFHSGNLKDKQNYDRMLVHFPYCLSYLPIQVIFDNLDNTSPPDFIITKNGLFLLQYKSITSTWLFRSSSSLYTCLSKIKECYSLEQEKRLLAFIKTEFEKQLDNNNFANNNNQINNYKNAIYENIEKIIYYKKSEISKYKIVNKEHIFFDCDYTSSTTDNNNNKIITLSYPLDCYIKSRKIQRMPVINICIPVDENYEMKFWMQLTIPDFIGKDCFNILKETEEISNYKPYIQGYEGFVYKQFANMKAREEMIQHIVNMNIGFVLEVDTLNFLSCNIYFKVDGCGNKKKGVVFYIVSFIFSWEDSTKFEMQVMNIAKLEILMRIYIDYGKGFVKRKAAAEKVLVILEKCIKVQKGKKEV